ncbi:hypothetical protein GC105_11450 [Alkalibaculum sp. M08DMB]|uniref:Uncharacterized protein n=1 Tax=Alkalibaculum sporogenes TaxID=2655001 RepID=A0A6A7KAD4_9FIRM|nr:hypothetical protein [Alkalibaculum sporogenes]MPW26404.1 hypothetical protein [Alkalibaculum sporogenes]
MRISNNSKRIPVYLDGFFIIYEVFHNETEDYPLDKLREVGIAVPFNELQIFDNTKMVYKAQGIEVTRKIRTRPIRFKNKSYLKIGESMYKIENSVTAVNSTGFQETDITLSKYTEAYEIEEVAE